MERFLLETERLILRLDTPETLREVFDTYSLPEQLEYLGLSVEDYPVQREKYELHIKRLNPLRVFYLLDKTTDKVIGACGYFRNWPEHARGEIGYALYEERYKRLGIMHEAMQPVMKYGFEVLNINRMEAITHPENIASRRLLEKNGFAFEGVLREHYNTGTAYDDSASYSILRKEYEARNISNNKR